MLKIKFLRIVLLQLFIIAPFYINAEPYTINTREFSTLSQAVKDRCHDIMKEADVIWGGVGDVDNAEMQENGVNMNELQMQLLQKVEELTLYIIQQEQRIQELESQLLNK